ncbi:uncharacterized protein DS421_13g407660 [Arachis hypogaea]|nr:uncharacterized protein DS421_13g407660 [Arachis hypogaea]
MICQLKVFNPIWSLILFLTLTAEVAHHSFFLFPAHFRRRCCAGWNDGWTCK